MRITFTLLMLVLFQTTHAQDFCNQINKNVSPDKTVYEYSSPYDPENPPTVRVTRSYGTDPEYATDNFFIIFQITGDLESLYQKSDTGSVEKEEHKLVVTFDDQSKFTDDTIKISHDLTNDRVQAVRSVYYPLKEASIKEFSAKKITKFSLGGYEQTVAADSANAIMHYVQCMKAVR